jgi:hypothetical protein
MENRTSSYVSYWYVNTNFAEIEGGKLQLITILISKCIYILFSIITDGI